MIKSSEFADVVTLAFSGDGPAFDQVYKTMHQYLMRRVNGDYHLAEDLASVVMRKAWEQQTSVQSREKIRSWMYQIADNTAIDHFRKNGKVQTTSLQEKQHNEIYGQTMLSSSFLVMNIAELPELFIIQQENQQFVKRVLNHLPQPYRECLVHRYIHGFKNSEIAAYLQVSERTIVRYLCDAKEEFKRVYQQFMIKDPMRGV